MGNKTLLADASRDCYSRDIRNLSVDQVLASQKDKVGARVLFDENIQKIMQAHSQWYLEYEDKKDKHFYEDLELNELRKTGRYTKDMSLWEINNPRFEKSYTNPLLRGESEEFLVKEKYEKMLELYYYMSKYSQDYEYLQEDFMKDLHDSRKQSKDNERKDYFEVSPSLALNLLKNFEKYNSEVLEEILKDVYITFKDMKEVELSPLEEKFYEREKILDSYREFLAEIFFSEKSTASLKEFALKIILLIGNVRSSGEDYLLVYNILCSHGSNANLETEIFMNKYFHQNLMISEMGQQRFSMKESKPEDIEVFLGNHMHFYNNNATRFAFLRES